jgi:hypothetical protein
MELRSRNCASWPTAVTLPQRLDNARSDDRPQLGWISYHADRHRTGVPPAETVRQRFHRFDEVGLDGLSGDRPGSGRKPPITEAERSLIISPVGTDPPGRLVRGAGGGELEAALDEERVAHWTLDALTAAAREQRGSRSGEEAPGEAHPQSRRSSMAKRSILDRKRGSRVRPKRSKVITLYTNPPPNSTVVCLDELWGR